MDIYADNFSLDKALQERGVKALETIIEALSKQVAIIDTDISKGLSPRDFAQAQHLRNALMAAYSIVALRFHQLSNDKK